MFEKQTRLWVVHITRYPELATRAQKEGFVCIGWSAAGDLTKCSTLEQVKAALHRAYPDWTNGKIASSASQAFRFVHEVQVGDPIILPLKGAREYVIGRVTGGYRWLAADSQLRDADSCNTRGVEWLKAVTRDVWTVPAANSFGAASSISRSDRFLPEVERVLQPVRANV